MDMDRPSTPAGPLLQTRGSNPVQREASSDVKTRPHGAHSKLRTGAMVQHPVPPGTQTAVYDLQTRPVIPGPRIRKPLGEVSNGLLGSSQQPYSTICRRRYGREEVSNDAMPSLNEHQGPVSCVNGILKSNGEVLVGEPTKQVRFGIPGSRPNHCPTAPSIPKKGMKFNEIDRRLARSPTSSAQSKKIEKQPAGVPCQIKGMGIKENINPDFTSRKIRVVRRTPNATTNAYSIFRRKLQQNLELRYSSESTALASDCVLRRHEAFPHPPGPKSYQARPSYRSAMRQTSRQPSTEKPVKPNVKGEEPSKRSAEDDAVDKQGEKFFSRLAEKAEEYFTRNLRHLHEKASTMNVVKTYVVENDPNDLLDKMNKSPFSLTTKNLEMHNIWLATVDTKESYNPKVTARERRIRRWVEDMQSSSRLNHMRVVNIVVKDKGFLVQNSTDDVLERMSQVPSQVPSQVMA